MGQVVVTGAVLMCPFGTAPSSLITTSQAKVMVSGMPAGTIQDMAPMVNIPPFGLCMSLANPQVAAATAAALGVLMPQPCLMVPAGTWIPTKPKVLMGGMTCLTSECTLMCAYGGCISITVPGQGKVIV